MDGYQEYTSFAAAIAAATPGQTAYELRDSGCSTYILAESEEDAREAATEWGQGGSYDERLIITIWYAPAIWDAEEEQWIADNDESRGIDMEAGPEPDEPSCERDEDGGPQEHDWPDDEIVNSVGGQFKYRAECARCGMVRRTTSASIEGQYPKEPERVEYEEAVQSGQTVRYK